ncbi:MAG TPA: acyl-CoA dehydratase activase [Desulfobacteraceae bacterium]|nr:acyl-CoA dehydratase activase [Desulfobacteraceae bacterium]HPJ69041.1 acyl-CoA dehydratase activase [Desulfobacteraceae bacterium]HPQ29518.1 acyl-CoA dehydratase activase [Desulfobacteraceae bacterium]
MADKSGVNDMLARKKTEDNESSQVYIGIDAGSVSINCVAIDEKKEILYEAPYTRHYGKVKELVFEIVKELYAKYGEKKIQAVSFTGNHAKSISEKLGTFYEFETISQVLGALSVQPDVRSIISMGGQETALFQINHFVSDGMSDNSGWELEYFKTNGPCASGTGSFIEQQAERLATSIYSEESDLARGHIDSILSEFIKLGLTSKKPANVACRCTVFTKSDMIHLQNKGERLEDIINGLHVGNARNYISTIVSNRVLEEPIIFIGGLSLNSLQVNAFRTYFPELIVPPHNSSIGALGVALQALESDIKNVPDLEILERAGSEDGISVPFAPRLELKHTLFSRTHEIEKRSFSGKTRVFLGIDIGSTTTKYVLINEYDEIIKKNYVLTQGKPIEVTQRLLGEMRDDLGRKIEIAGAATTGSGRNVVGDFLNVDLIIDEITAHATGAVKIDPDVDTIFEIGGQDSKYIYLSNSYPLDFDMNKVCAAGTGSFLHELANKYGINIVGEFEEIALSSDSPVKLAERCTVFMESDLVSYHQKGVDHNDLMAGLCYAIVHNYLNRVVGKRKIGQGVMFLGGPSLNKGVVAAFENVLGRGLTVPQHREVLGAYGAALSVKEKMMLDKRDKSTLRELDSIIKDRLDYTEKVCHADKNCHNQCKLKIYDFDGRRSVWGGECGRYEVVRTGGAKKENLFEMRQKILQNYLAGVCEELSDEALMEIDARPTVGMQRALYGIQTAVLWAHFFDQLGFRLIMTPPTNMEISRKGIESMVAETCYPVMVSHGHIRELIGRTKYLFIPTIINMSGPELSEASLYCPMLQSNSYMVRSALNIDPSSILSPAIHLKHDPEKLALEIWQQIQSKLGVRKSDVRKALLYAMERQRQFEAELYKEGSDILEAHSQDEPFVVVTGRPYNLYDERLNLRLGQNLSRIGVTALPMDFIDVSSVDLSDFPSMYWGLGARILRTARFIKENDNCYGLHLTNFECGADSFLEHFYKHIMDDKAYLILELDEHSAVAGVMTRLEAYKNVIDNTMQKGRTDMDIDLKMAN